MRAIILCVAASVTSGVLLPQAGAVAPSAAIPLCPGLTIVTAVSQPQGDYESIKRVESVTPESARIRYSSYRPDPCCEASGSPLDPPWVPFVVHRTVRRIDLEASASYLQVFTPGDVPETVRGTTALGISRNSFRELRDKGKTPLTLYQPFHPKFGIKDDGSPLFFGVDPRMPGTLTRVDPTPVTVSVLVNDRMTPLPAIRARGKFLWDDDEFFFLYDEANPISLKFRLGIAQPTSPETQKLIDQNPDLKKLFDDPAAKEFMARQNRDRDVLQVVKITHTCEDPTLTTNTGGGSGGSGGGGGGGATGPGAGAARLEESLAKAGRAEIYSIYFSFNGDVIREESEPTLKEIAGLLKKHADWKLGIEGHTDNIASDRFNLDLARRRAAAVRDALVKRYGIEAARLTTAGFGESRPKDTNDTLEGRARNRRVELVRTGG